MTKKRRSLFGCVFEGAAGVVAPSAVLTDRPELVSTGAAVTTLEAACSSWARIGIAHNRRAGVEIQKRLIAVLGRYLIPSVFGTPP